MQSLGQSLNLGRGNPAAPAAGGNGALSGLLGDVQRVEADAQQIAAADQAYLAALASQNEAELANAGAVTRQATNGAFSSNFSHAVGVAVATVGSDAGTIANVIGQDLGAGPALLLLDAGMIEAFLFPPPQAPTS